MMKSSLKQMILKKEVLQKILQLKKSIS